MPTWYVSDKVASSGAGTSLALAFKTIAEAIAAGATNDIIEIHEGVYNEGNFTTTKRLEFHAVGFVELNGGGTLNYFYQAGSGYGPKVFSGFYVRNYLQYAINYISGSSSGLTFYLKNNIFENKVRCGVNTLHIRFEKNVILADSGAIFAIQLASFEGNLIRNCVCTSNEIAGFYTRYNIIDNASLIFNSDLVSDDIYYNNFINSGKIAFLSQSAVVVTSVSEILAKYLADGGGGSPTFSSNTFDAVTYNNTNKGNYTLEYSLSNKPAFNLFSGGAQGPFDAAMNWIMKTVPNGGNVELYNIGTDFYGIGIFGGKSQVGNIDSIGEKIERTTDGANNWGVFLLKAQSLPRAHKFKNLRAFGTIIDRNGGQFSKTPGDFAYNYQVDILVAWSATQDAATLEADIAATFVRFRYRNNEENNYYVNNGGVLVGDGEPSYITLVDSSDGGSGSLPPLQITAKSIMAIAILQDV